MLLPTDPYSMVFTREQNPETKQLICLVMSPLTLQRCSGIL